MSVTIFACTRASDRPRCSTANCGGRATAECSFLLSGKKQGQRCDRALCDRCARKVGEAVMCPVHARMSAAKAGA